MRLFVVSMLLLSACLACATPARADRFGDVEFQVPRGWQKVENGGFAILAGPLDTSGKPRAAIFVTPGCGIQRRIH